MEVMVVDSSGLIKGSNKKGILLISTLFFIIVLIMMSVALFALTRANYADMRSFYSENEAITNAESAINIASFIIASNSVLLTINSSEESNPTYEESNPTDSVNLGTLINNDNTNIIKRINANNYRIVIVNLRDGTIRSNDNTNINIDINNNPSQDMAAMIISPRNKSISDSGAILFFGNSTSTTNTYNTQSANAVAVSFENNQINFYFNNNGNNYPAGLSNSYPLYTSVNNVNNNSDITNINGYRNANKYTLLLMAMGYSRVPNTNRYVVRYVDQKLANGGLLSASLYTGGLASFTTTGTLNIVADYVKNNRLIANNFEVNLVDNRDNPKTKFSLTSENDSSVVGKLVATSGDNNTGKYKVGDVEYNLRQLTENPDILDTVKDKTKGTVEQKIISFNFDNTYNNFRNAVNTASQNAKTLNAGWYIFKDSSTIYYYSPDKKISDIVDGNGNLKNPPDKKYVGLLKDSSGQRIASISNYSIDFDPDINVKFSSVEGKPAFVFITSFKSVNRVPKFGAYDVNINLNGNILQSQDLGFVVDGTFKGEGVVAVTGDGNDIGSIDGGFKSFKYFESSFSEPYDYLDVQRMTNMTNPLKKGTLVARFDYLKSSSNKVAILVDNDMYINPTFQEIDTSFMDYLLMESLKQWADSSYVRSVSSSSVSSSSVSSSSVSSSSVSSSSVSSSVVDKRDIFQVMTGFADSKFKINNQHQDIKLWDILFYSNNNNSTNTFNLKDGDFKDYKLEFTKSYKEFLFGDFNSNSSLMGSYDSSTGILTISYNGKNVNIEVSSETSGVYTFSYGGKQVTLNENVVPDSIKNLITSTSTPTKVIFGDFAALWYSILKESFVPSPSPSNTSTYNDLLSYYIKNNLEGSFNEYKTFLSNNGLKNNPGKNALNGNIDKNYFAWIDMRQEGLTIGEEAAEKLRVSKDYSFLDKKTKEIGISSNITNVKLEGMIMVKGKLIANTGVGNLTFRGLTLVKNNMNVKSNNTTFFFDLDNIDVNLLAGSVINLVPILYKQESVISK